MKSNRRNFLQKVTLGAAGLGLSASAPVSAFVREQHARPEAGDDQVLFIGDNIAVANTTYGKIRGYILKGIYTYLGIPYGADTSGENRFMPPKKPTSWTETKSTVWWGNSAPQNMEKRYAVEICSRRL